LFLFSLGAPLNARGSGISSAQLERIKEATVFIVVRYVKLESLEKESLSESDVVLVPSKDRHVIDHDVRFEDSDHHRLKSVSLHQVRYRPKAEQPEVESW